MCILPWFNTVTFDSSSVEYISGQRGYLLISNFKRFTLRAQCHSMLIMALLDAVFCGFYISLAKNVNDKTVKYPKIKALNSFDTPRVSLIHTEL